MSSAFYQRLENAPIIHQRSHAAHLRESSRSAQETTAAPVKHYWYVRGWPLGSPEEDWFRAERELRYLRLHG